MFLTLNKKIIMKVIDYYRRLFLGVEVYEAESIVRTGEYRVVTLKNSAVGVIPNGVMTHVEDQKFDTPVKVQITGFSDFLQALVLRPVLDMPNVLTRNLVVYEGILDLITPQGLGIKINGELFAFQCWQKFYDKMCRGDKIKVLMYANDRLELVPWTIKEARINGIPVDFMELNGIDSLKYPGVIRVCFLEWDFSLQKYKNKATGKIFGNIPSSAGVSFCLYDLVEDKVLTAWR